MPSIEKERAALRRRLTTAIAIPIVLLIAVGLVLGRQILQMADDARWVDHTDQVIASTNDTYMKISDQESGLRGYLITGKASYLEIFQRVRPADGFQTLSDMVADNPPQQRRFLEAKQRYESWLSAVEPVLRGQEIDTARSLESMGERTRRMEAVQLAVRRAVEAEEVLRRDRVKASETSIAMTKQLAVALFFGAAVILAFLSRRQLAAVAQTFGDALRAETEARKASEAEAWVRAGVSRLAATLQGEKTVPQVGADCLTMLAEYTGADVGAFFARDGGGWRRKAGHGTDKGTVEFADGEGLIGRAAREGNVVVVEDVPPDLLQVSSGLLKGAPAEVFLVPACIDGAATAVVEVGFFKRPPERVRELFGRIGESIGSAVRSSEYKEQLKALLEEAQRQAEELQAQQEELRVSNEELEAQTTTLRVTQKQLETQTAEIEQTNDNLVQQQRLLERQNEQLAEKQAEIEAKAQEVARASQFKSEFLSNMSHELRTPLNSSLILAKLLAENRGGNLTDEQVKFAETIYGAGNDLLLLINDILDLSKIEAGKMDIHAGTVSLDRVAENLRRTFEPVAKQKGIGLHVLIETGHPSMHTDSQRLEQVLKNLVSNAVKFTEKGEVRVIIEGDDAHVRFVVRDTGIGISEAQQAIIFEAFHQADGTTSRKYGGTGLGLSISRELSRLLGGDVSVTSAPGKGSTFTLTLPRAYVEPANTPKSAPPAPPPPRSLPLPPKPSAPPAVEPEPDFDPQKRTVLIIEDDETFANVLADVAREAGFQALVANTAARGMELAKRHPPIGIVLDMKLPDHTGLSVLDRLKRNPATRHIPVHVISGSDHIETALSMGAAAYLLKPVEREQLVDALRALQAHSEHRLRRVLIVEDDAALRDSVAKLLGKEDVEISTAGTVKDALALLRQHTFDCVVTDLQLPGQSGYDLLETMASDEPYSVPPVIVYTGRTLTSEEETRLRKYSKSIIVKGARSPERLLDEVTLFLHQVESDLPPDKQRLLNEARHREAVFEGRKILVVEDDVRNVFALTSVLEPKGAKVVIARNGKEALTALEKDAEIDLVLMDVMMPEMDGLEATREIRKNPAHARLPIISLTAKAMRDDQEKCLAAGANDYLAKPLDVEMLLSLLRVWMPKV